MEQNQARSRLKPKKVPFFKKYLHFMPCFLLALGTYFLLYLLIRKIYPTQIQNFVIKNSYFPFFALLFVANFFFFTFLFLNQKIGLLLALFINLILYFRLNQFVFNGPNFLSLSLLTVIFALLIWSEKIISLRHK